MDNSIRVVYKNGKRFYENNYGYVNCEHACDLIEVITRWGNKSYVCPLCGEVVKKETTPTSF